MGRGTGVHRMIRSPLRNALHRGRVVAFAILLSELARVRSTGGQTLRHTVRAQKLAIEVPPILLNGVSREICVGMATDILPHNIRRLCPRAYACSKKSGQIKGLTEHIQGPDFRPKQRSSHQPRKCLRSINLAQGLFATSRVGGGGR
ncbi:MAG: hypothetical protein Ct9H300mP14_12960 [Gammaproteobacteria bacterium]|nr:MAG: hypothetical protein Ct9H300mP14_12960 [Gammaproteobacteria bacterium]